MAATRSPLNQIDKTFRPGPNRPPHGAIGLAEAVYYFFMILGRTDLRTGVSGAKFDPEADFEVRLPPDPPKPRENIEKLREMFDKNIQFFFKYFF